MAKIGRPRGRATTGVRVCKNQWGLYAQWVDPRSGRTVCVSFNKLVRDGHIAKPTKSAAEKWLKDKAKEIAQWAAEGISLSGVGAKWDAIEAAYVEHFKAEHGTKAADFLSNYHLRYWRHFAHDRGLRTGGDLRQPHLTGFRSGMPHDLKPSYKNRIMGAVRAYLGWCADNEYVSLSRGNLKTGLKAFKTPEGLARVLSKAEIKRLLKAIVEHDCKPLEQRRGGRFGGKVTTYSRAAFEPMGPLVLLLLLTGCRVGEALSLKVVDCDVEGGRLRVWGAKTAKMREVVMDKSPALHALATALKLRAGRQTHLLGDWQDADGKVIPRDVHHRQWKRVRKLAGLDGVPIKALRSTAVAYSASAGKESEYLLEARFGHSGDVSKRYYRQPIHGITGDTLEAWYGVASELDAAMHALGLTAKGRGAVKAG